MFNVGDSRTYRVEDGALRRITVDHSVVQEMVDAGVLRAEDAEAHPDSNVITRAVGFGEPPEPDWWTLPLRTGDRYIICSDGLTKEIGDAGHRADRRRRSTDPQELAERLVGDALVAGGRDNVTVVVLQVEDAPERQRPRGHASSTLTSGPRTGGPRRCSLRVRTESPPSAAP